MELWLNFLDLCRQSHHIGSSKDEGSAKVSVSPLGLDRDFNYVDQAMLCLLKALESKYARRARYLISCLIQLYLVVMIILVALRSLPSTVWFVDFSSTIWSFGQVIAVFIWLQPLLDYLRMAIAGIEKASRHRIHQPYKVVCKNMVRTRFSDALYND